MCDTQEGLRRSGRAALVVLLAVAHAWVDVTLGTEDRGHRVEGFPSGRGEDQQTVPGVIGQNLQKKRFFENKKV